MLEPAATLSLPLASTTLGGHSQTDNEHDPSPIIESIRALTPAASTTPARRAGQVRGRRNLGAITPIMLAPGVRTIGELEVVAHIEAGLPLIDTRLPKYAAAGTIPTARAVPHNETTHRLNTFDDGVDTVLFCNGPQCAATPAAMRTLLGAGHPAERLLYYRGGIHDWVTLGLPLAPAAEQPAR